MFLLLLLPIPYCGIIVAELLKGIVVLFWKFSLFALVLWILGDELDESTPGSRWLNCPLWLLYGLYGLETLFWLLLDKFKEEFAWIEIIGRPFWFGNEHDEFDEEVDDVSVLDTAGALVFWGDGEEIADCNNC